MLLTAVFLLKPCQDNDDSSTFFKLYKTSGEQKKHEIRKLKDVAKNVHFE